MQQMHGFDMLVNDPGPAELSARGRLTAAVLALAERPESDAGLLSRTRDVLDEVLVADARFPFHLAAYVTERLDRPRVAVALLVEASNRVVDVRRRAGRVATAPLSLRTLVRRIVRGPGDAAYAMAWQVRHFGWGMPSMLRASLTDVLQRTREPQDGDDEADPAHSSRPAPRALQPALVPA